MEEKYSSHSSQIIELIHESASHLALTWPGKRLAVCVPVPEMRLAEVVDPQKDSTQRRRHPRGTREAQRERNLLLHGDNRETLAWLLANGYAGQVKLIYIDPPFDSDSNYTSSLRLRGSGKVIGTQVQYADRWQGSDYLQFMAERLLLLKMLLHPNGTIWLHCDHRASARLLLLMEEIFGSDAYLNTIAWRSQVARGAKVHARYFPRSTHSIHIFAASAGSNPAWHPPRREITMTRAETARRYLEDERGFFRTSDPGTYSFEALCRLHAEGRIYAPYGGEVVIDEEAQQVYASNGGNIGIKYYVEKRGRDRFVVTRAVDNLWDDIPGLGTIPSEDVNYPTQKTEGLLQRILETATDPDDLVLDAFIGSGTTVAVAEKLGRRWIGCDDNWGAIRTTAGRIFNAEGQESGRVREQESEGAGERSVCGWSIYQVARAEIPQSDVTVDVRVERTAAGLRVMIEDVRSPMLAQMIRDAGEPLPEDWRAMVRSVAIDLDFDGEVFWTAVADAPTGRRRLVTGDYIIVPGKIVAVRVVDILGQESTTVLSASTATML